MEILKELKEKKVKVWGYDRKRTWIDVFYLRVKRIYIEDIFPGADTLRLAAREAATKVLHQMGFDKLTEAHVGAYTTFLLAALATENGDVLHLAVEILKEKYDDLWALPLLLDAGGRPGGGIGGTYTDAYSVYDRRQRKIIVFTERENVGRWIGRGGIRIRQMRAMLRTVGWDIEIKAMEGR